MSDWALGKKLNSQIANVPLNHLIWLNDYKTFGENSYVFQDKRILKELYASPIAANDAKIYEEAKTYNRASMTIDDLAKWFCFRYEFSDRNSKEIRLLAKGFNSWTDEELSSAIEMHYNDEIDISKCAFVGEKRSVTLSAMDATGVGESQPLQTVEFAIADFSHDNLTAPINGHEKSAITLTQIGLLSINGYINGSSWYSCARRTWCNNVYYNAIPLELKNLVKSVEKLSAESNSSTAIKTTSENVFLFSGIEINGSDNFAPCNEGSQYSYYKISGNRIKNNNGTTNNWWTRSIAKSQTSTFEAFDIYGNITRFSSGASYGLCIGMCI